MKTIAIIGTGAIGGYYGIQLLRAHYNVNFLLNSDFEFVKKNGLTLETKDEKLQFFPVACFKNPSDMPKCDLVIISLKTTSNYLLPNILPAVCHKNSLILNLQNGIDTHKQIFNIMPENKIFAGLCSIACNKIAPGYFKHIDFQEIHLGEFHHQEQSNTISNELKTIAEIFESAEIPIKISENIVEAQWRKLIWNITFNGLTTVLDCDTKTIMTTPHYRQRAINLLAEAINLANAVGIPVEQEFLEKMLNLTDSLRPYKPSMKLDRENNRPLELEAIYLRPMNYAHNIHFPIPEIEKLYKELCDCGK